MIAIPREMAERVIGATMNSRLALAGLVVIPDTLDEFVWVDGPTSVEELLADVLRDCAQALEDE